MLLVDILFFGGVWSFLGWIALGVFLKVRFAQWKVRRGGNYGWLYFIGNGEGPIKVGVTRGDPKQILKELQAGSPSRLRVIHAFSVKDPEGTEQQTYNVLREFHVGSEWYDRDVVLHFIDELKGSGGDADNVIPFPNRRGVA